MSQLPAMPMWWADFFSKTDHLTNEEQWAYAKLLAKTWLRNGRPFQDEPKDLARLLGMGIKRWLRIRERIAPFFDLSEGTWRQDRLEKEYGFVARRAAVSRANGAQGGRPSGAGGSEFGFRESTQRNPNLNSVEHHSGNGECSLFNDFGNPMGSFQESTHTHTYKVSKKESPFPTKVGERERAKPRERGTNPRVVGSNARATGTNPRPHTEIDDEFDQLWPRFPRRVGKGQARSAYRRARRKTDASTIATAVSRFADSVVDREERFVPHPATWLNGERWGDDDELPAGPYRPDVAEADRDARDLGGSASNPTLGQWRRRCAYVRDGHEWDWDRWGVSPGPGCGCPPDILAEYGLAAPRLRSVV